MTLLKNVCCQLLCELFCQLGKCNWKETIGRDWEKAVYRPLFMLANILVYQADECALCGIYVRATRIELHRNDLCHHNTATSCLQLIPKSYFQPTFQCS